TDPLTPFDEARRITGQLMLKVFHPTEKLPVRILQKASQHQVIGEIVKVLEVMQSHHQTGRQRGPANALRIERAELIIKDLPVEGLGQQIKRVLRVEHLTQR